MIKIVFFLCCFISTTYAQKHDYFFPIGYDNNASPSSDFGGVTIDFNHRPAKIYTQKKKINMDGYCASCSDSTGQWLFYSNGIEVHTRQHQIMHNGDSINYADGEIWNLYKTIGYPSMDGSLVPFPGRPNQYLMLHQAITFDYVNELILGSPFYYSRIDMNASGGLGSVVAPNQVIRTGNLTDYVVTKHGNGRDWWVIIAERSQPKHYVYLVDSTGVHLYNEQDYGPSFPVEEANFFFNISPDGNTYVRVDYVNGLRIYDFDRCSGTLSNLRIFPFYGQFNEGTAITNVEFSPDSRLLYLNSFSTVMQIDMSAPEPYTTLDTIAQYDGFATPQPFATRFMRSALKPDGKIYYSHTNSTLAMHVIHRPNSFGLSSDVEQHGLHTLKYYFLTMCRTPNYRLGKWEGSPCDSIQLHHPPEGFSNTLYNDRNSNVEKKSEKYTVWPAIGQKKEKKGRGIPMNSTAYLLYQDGVIPKNIEKKLKEYHENE